MSPLHSLRQRLRSLLSGPHKRSLPRRSRKPRIGAYVVQAQEGLRLVVQAGMSDEMWQWLQDLGWRTETFRPDRREYRDIPASWVTRLIDADPPYRDKLLAEAVVSAQPRAALVRKA